VQTDSGLTISADKFVVCTGGVSKRLPIPGFEFTSTHSDAWELTAVPESMVGDVGHRHRRRDRGAVFGDGHRRPYRLGSVECFEKTDSGVTTHLKSETERTRIDADLVVVPVGWATDVSGLHLDNAGVETTARGFIEVDEYQCTSNPNVFAAGDVTGRVFWLQRRFATATSPPPTRCAGPAPSTLPTSSPTAASPTRSTPRWG
jgi:hypothetical protein